MQEAWWFCLVFEVVQAIYTAGPTRRRTAHELGFRVMSRCWVDGLVLLQARRMRKPAVRIQERGERQEIKSPDGRTTLHDARVCGELWKRLAS